jgi:hypothetical protein
MKITAGWTRRLASEPTDQPLAVRTISACVNVNSARTWIVVQRRQRPGPGRADAQGLPPWIGLRVDGPFSVWTARFGAATRLGWRYPAKQGHDEHQELLDALRARDPERAEELMRTHPAHRRAVPELGRTDSAVTARKAIPRLRHAESNHTNCHRALASAHLQ